MVWNVSLLLGHTVNVLSMYRNTLGSNVIGNPVQSSCMIKKVKRSGQEMKDGGINECDDGYEYMNW